MIWKDQAAREKRQEKLAVEADVSTVTIDGKSALSYRKPGYTSSIYREWTRRECPRAGRKFKQGEVNAESLVQAVAEKLNLYTNIHRLDALQALEDTDVHPHSPQYRETAEALEAQIQLYISHYGMSKGDNRYIQCNKVLILGDFVLPREVYTMYDVLLQGVLTDERIWQSIFATT